MDKTLKRNDVVGTTVKRLLLRRDDSVNGFGYVEAVVELDDGNAF